MRAAALYDVHGNMAALDAVLAELDDEPVDVVVVGGDFSAGPQAPEAVDRLRALGERVRFVRGNADRELADLDWRPDDEPAGTRVAWMRERLGAERLEFLRALPEQVSLEIDGLGRVLFCHGSPRSDLEILTRATPEERLRDAVRHVDAAVVVCGHTHAQWRRDLAGVVVVNAGSVGLPYEGRPGAYWARFGPAVEHRRTVYDIEAAAALYREVGFPDADEYSRETLLEPPPPGEVVEFFEQLARDKPEYAGSGA